MVLVMFVLNEAEKLGDVLHAWEQAGVSGITVLHSTGLGRYRQEAGWRDDLPLMPSLSDLYEHEEFFSRTLFSIVKDEAMAAQLVRVTERVVGDLSRPGVGLVVVMPVLQVHGLINLG